MSRLRLPLLLMLAACLSSTAPSVLAAIYKCASDGGPLYQDSPCPAGHELRDFQADPPTVSVVPFAKASPETSATATRGDARTRSQSRKSDASSARGGNSRSVTTTRSRKGASGSAAERKFLHMGMSEPEVMARIGAPDMRSAGSRGGARWSYLPHADDPQTITTVTFADGVVSNIERRMVR